MKKVAYFSLQGTINTPTESQNIDNQQITKNKEILIPLNHNQRSGEII